MRTLSLCVVFLLHGILFAQVPLSATSPGKQQKPLLFRELPDSFECKSSGLQSIISHVLNEQFHAQLSDQFEIDGKIIFRDQSVPGTVSINVRLLNYRNALFNLSVRLLADNSTSIRGRILHPHYGDVLVLSKQGDRYFFKKNSSRLVMPE